MRHFRFAFALLLASLPARSAWSRERTDTCVDVAASSDREALRTLVESELDRHPSHHAVRDGCVSYLRVELIELDRERFLTARINEQVPERVRVGPGGVEAAVTKLLTVVLHNDPVRLRGPISRNWLGEQREAFVTGQNQFALEGLQLFALLDGAPPDPARLRDLRAARGTPLFPRYPPRGSVRAEHRRPRRAHELRLGQRGRRALLATERRDQPVRLALARLRARALRRPRAVPGRRGAGPRSAWGFHRACAAESSSSA